MAMLSSYYTTLLMNRAPATAPAKSSPAAGSLQLRSRQPPPAAAASVAALRWAATCKDKESPSSRAAVFACRAQNNKYTYNIERDVLLHLPTLSGDNWSIMEDKDHFILKFRVGESTSNDKLEVTTTEDQARLVIKYRGGGGSDVKDAGDDDNPASSLNVQLTMPPGYDGRNAKGMMSSNGWLIIAIPKPKHEARKIDISPPPSHKQ